MQFPSTISSLTSSNSKINCQVKLRFFFSVIIQIWIHKKASAREGCKNWRIEGLYFCGGTVLAVQFLKFKLRKFGLKSRNIPELIFFILLISFCSTMYRHCRKKLSAGLWWVIGVKGLIQHKVFVFKFSDESEAKRALRETKDKPLVIDGRKVKKKVD